ncbi:MAG: DNA internalization-related competence protein ComEC/Rec2 [Desulfovermiculus sp.]|nr:DNA internalization-related competence protein ComEC/Rec2 [Desulfovermiculus sp.]
MNDGRGVPQSRKGKVFVDLLPWQWFILHVLAGLYAFEFPLAGGTACGLLVVLMSLYKRYPLGLTWVPVAFALGLMWAWWHAPLSAPPMPEWMEHRREVDIQAKVKAVTFKPENRIQILLSDVRCIGEDFEHSLLGMTVWTWQNPPTIPAPGQEVKARLRIKPVDGFDNFHTWDTRAYWARQGVLYRTFTKEDKALVLLEGKPKRLWNWRQQLRSQVLEATRPGPGQGLLMALLMGDRSQLRYQTLDLVRRASLAHSLALSGLHLGFVISLGWAVAWSIGWFWPRIFLILPRPMISVALGFPLVVSYLWLGQGRDSLLRAALMFVFWVVLLLSGRSKALLDGLFFALLIFLLWDPLAVFSLGWQLSMVAVAGILLLWPVVGARFDNQRSRRKKVLLFLGSFLLLSLIANTALLPLLMHNFGQMSPHLYLNVLWLPVLGFCVLPLGLVGMVLSLSPGVGALGESALFLAGRVLDALATVLVWLNSHGWLEAVVTPRPGWLECLGYWLILGALLAGMQTKKVKGKSLGVAALGGVILLSPWLAANLSWSHNSFQLRVLDVGQGQAVFLEGPQGERTLIDGGGSWNPDFDLGRFALSPALTYRAWPRVDTVVLSHPDFDHLRGLFFILKHYAVERFVFNGQWPKGEDGRVLRQILQEREIHVRKVQAGDQLKIGSQLYLDVVHPSKYFATNKDNDMSLVFRVGSQGQGLALIPGDLEAEGIAALLDSGNKVKADLLVVPHHGSRGSLSPKLYERVDPELAIISCGFLNIFRFPHDQVQKALKQAGVPVYCTSDSGEVQVRWDLDAKKIRSMRTWLDDG